MAYPLNLDDLRTSAYGNLDESDDQKDQHHDSEDFSSSDEEGHHHHQNSNNTSNDIFLDQQQHQQQSGYSSSSPAANDILFLSDHQRQEDSPKNMNEDSNSNNNNQFVQQQQEPVSVAPGSSFYDPPTERNNNKNNTNSSTSPKRPGSANPRLQQAMQNSSTNQNDQNNNNNNNIISLSSGGERAGSADSYHSSSTVVAGDENILVFDTHNNNNNSNKTNLINFENNSNHHHQKKQGSPYSNSSIDAGLPPRPVKPGSSKPPRPFSHNQQQQFYHASEYDHHSSSSGGQNQENQNPNQQQHQSGLPIDTSARDLNSDEGRAIQLVALELKQIYSELGLLRPDCPTQELDRKSKWLVLASQLLAFYQNSSPIMEPEEWEQMGSKAQQLRHELERMKRRRTMTVKVCRAVEEREGSLRDLHRIVVAADEALYSFTAKRRRFDRKSAGTELVKQADEVATKVISLTQEVLKLLIEWAKTIGSKVILRSLFQENQPSANQFASHSFVVATNISDSDSSGSDEDDDEDQEEEDDDELERRLHRQETRKVAFEQLCELFSFRGTLYLEKIRLDSAFVHQTTSLNALFARDSLNMFKKFMNIGMSSSQEQEQPENEHVHERQPPAVSPALSRISGSTSKSPAGQIQNQQQSGSRSRKLRHLTRNRLPGNLPLSNSPAANQHNSNLHGIADHDHYHHHGPSLTNNSDILQIGQEQGIATGQGLHIFSTSAAPANSLVHRIRGSIQSHHQHQHQDPHQNQNQHQKKRRGSLPGDLGQFAEKKKKPICCGFLDEQEFDHETVSDCYDNINNNNSGSESRSRSRSPPQFHHQDTAFEGRPKSRRGSIDPPPAFHSDPTSENNNNKTTTPSKQRPTLTKRNSKKYHHGNSSAVAGAAEPKPLSPIPHSALPKPAGHGDRHRVTASIGSLGVVLDAAQSDALFGGNTSNHQHHQQQHSRTPPPHHNSNNNNRVQSALSTTSTIPASAPSSPPPAQQHQQQQQQQLDNSLDRNVYINTTPSGYQQRMITPPPSSQNRIRHFPTTTSSGNGAAGSEQQNQQHQNQMMTRPSSSSTVTNSPILVRTDGESLSPADELIFKGGHHHHTGISPAVPPPNILLDDDDLRFSPSSVGGHQHHQNKFLISATSGGGDNDMPNGGRVIEDGDDENRDGDIHDKSGLGGGTNNTSAGQTTGLRRDKDGLTFYGNSSEAPSKIRDSALKKTASYALALMAENSEKRKQYQQHQEEQQQEGNSSLIAIGDSSEQKKLLFTSPSASRSDLRNSITQNASTASKFSQDADGSRSAVFGGSHHHPVSGNNTSSHSNNRSSATIPTTKIHQIVAAEQREKRERERAKHDAAMMRMKHPAFRRNAYSSRHARNAKGPAEYWSSVVVFFVLIKSLANKALKRARRRIAARKLSAWFSRIYRARYVVKMISDQAWQALLTVREKNPAWTNNLHLRCAFDHAFAVAHMRAFYIQKAFYRYRLRSRFYDTVVRVVAGLRIQRFIRQQFQIVYKLRVALMKRAYARKIQRWFRIFRRWSNPLFRQSVNQLPGEDRANYKRRIINGATSYTKSRLAVRSNYDKQNDKMTYIPHTLETFLEAFKLDFEFNDMFTWRMRNLRIQIDGRIFRFLSNKIRVVQRFATAMAGNKRIRMYQLHYQVHRLYAANVLRRRLVPTGRVIKPFLVACYSARLVAAKKQIAVATETLQRVAKHFPEMRRRINANHRAVAERSEMMELFARNSEKNDAASRIQRSWRSRLLKREAREFQLNKNHGLITADGEVVNQQQNNNNTNNNDFSGSIASLNNTTLDKNNTLSLSGGSAGGAGSSPSSPTASTSLASVSSPVRGSFRSLRLRNLAVRSQTAASSKQRGGGRHRHHQYNLETYLQRQKQDAGLDNEREYAALRIQTAYRMHRAYKVYKQTKAAWIFIKDEWSDMFTYTAPVMKIQTKFRRILDRNVQFARHRQRRAQHQAALTIQAVWQAAKEAEEEKKNLLFGFGQEEQDNDHENGRLMRREDSIRVNYKQNQNQNEEVKLKRKDSLVMVTRSYDDDDDDDEDDDFESDSDFFEKSSTEGGY